MNWYRRKILFIFRLIFLTFLSFTISVASSQTKPVVPLDRFSRFLGSSFACSPAPVLSGPPAKELKQQKITSLPCLASSANNDAAESSPDIFVQPPMTKQPPADRGNPDQRETTTSRGPEESVDIPFTALVPDEGEIWGLTVQEYPTFWLYIPYSSTQEFHIEFWLRNEQDKSILINKSQPIIVPYSRTPGLIGFRIPPTETPLEVEKLYRWSFSIKCKGKDLCEEIVVRGWVERMETPSVNYPENGIWFDILNDIAERFCSDPEDASLRNSWFALLKAVKLEKLVEEEIIPNCVSHNSQ